MKEQIDYFRDCTDSESLRTRFRELAKVHHPDVGGDERVFAVILNQYDSYQRIVKPKVAVVTAIKQVLQSISPEEKQVIRESVGRVGEIFGGKLVDLWLGR